MNLFRGSFLAAMMLTLTGCAQQSKAPASDNSVHWWNPFSYSWASALPWSWSGGSPVVSEQGVGKLNAMTPFTQTALASGLSRDYTLRQGIETRNGHIDSYWQAIKNGQPVMTLSGETTVSRVEVTDPDAKGPGGGDRITFCRSLYQSLRTVSAGRRQSAGRLPGTKKPPSSIPL